VEQAGAVGKRPAIPGHDRPPLDPIFESGFKIAASTCAILDVHRKDHKGLTNRPQLVLVGRTKVPMNHTFGNVYEDEERARAYATLQFPGTYYLAFRDLPGLIRRYNHGSRALDFGCGTGRSTRFLRNLGLNVIGADISQPMLDQARALDPSGDYHLVRDNIASEFPAASFDVILAAFTFDNIPTEAKANALSALRILLAPVGCLLLVVSSPAIYVNEWASFSTRDFPGNRQARDGDLVRITMLDVPDRRPVDDVFCTDAHYRHLFESAGLKVLDVQRPLATGKETTRWVSETTTPAWTIYVLGSVIPAM
jgi:SAM-dependent methyltransferase